MVKHERIAVFVAGLAALLAVAASAVAADLKEGFFTTNDGYRLHYIEAGSGAPLVMIPGWSQTAAQFKHQISGLSDQYHVIALDMRGHGESEKPDHGYRIHRLSKDVYDFLSGRGLTGVTLAGHSMGCSVIWGYWELFGRERLA
ncbi:MAG: alpha/beta hydrolase, partial [Proteobacteria bacterium]